MRLTLRRNIRYHSRHGRGHTYEANTERRRQKTIARTTDMMTSEMASVMREPNVPTCDMVRTWSKNSAPTQLTRLGRLLGAMSLYDIAYYVSEVGGHHDLAASAH